MHVTAENLRVQVIRPTLEYLHAWNLDTEQFLLDAAIDSPELGLFSVSKNGLGIFNITSDQHRDIWDNYLALDPDKASLIRGLASQRQFLSDPDAELKTNLSYCTAIAWLLYQRSNISVSGPQHAVGA